MNKTNLSSSNFTEFIGDISMIKGKPSCSNMTAVTEYIGEVTGADSRKESRLEDDATRADDVGDRLESEVEEKEGGWLNNIGGLAKSFEQEGILGVSFGIVQAVTSSALNVVSGTASNVGHLLTNHPENNEQALVRDKKTPEDQKKSPAVLQFASYIADIVLGAVSPVLDLHFFGYAPHPMNDTKFSIYWDSPSVRKSIGYDYDACSFVGTESVYFDTRSVGYMSAITGEASVAESLKSEDDFYSAVSREEVEELSLEFV